MAVPHGRDNPEILQNKSSIRVLVPCKHSVRTREEGFGIVDPILLQRDQTKTVLGKCNCRTFLSTRRA